MLNYFSISLLFRIFRIKYGSITGKWIGEYVYGHSYEEEMRGKCVKFSMELQWDGELIKGSSVDEETKEIFSEPSKRSSLLLFVRWNLENGKGLTS